MAYTLTEQDKLLARQNAMQRFQTQMPQTTQKSSGNFLTSLLPTAGGILGGIGGTLLGPGLGTAAGGAAGAGLGKTLQNILEGKKDVTEGVLGEAAFGTLGGVGKGLSAIKGAGTALKTGQGLSKAAQALRYGTPAASTLGTAANVAKAGLISKIGAGTEKLGQKMIGSQSLLTGAQARQAGLSPIKTLSNVNKRTGLYNLDDMADVSRNLTGAKGAILDTATRAAVGETTGVKLGDLGKSASNYIDDIGTSIPNEIRKNILTSVNRASSSLYGGAKGSLSTLANPQKVLDVSSAFRGQARSLTNKFTTTAAEGQQAKIFNKLADNMENALYSSAGVKESLPSIIKATSDDLLFKAQEMRAAGNISKAKAYEALALESRNIKSVKDLRSFKKDFVDTSKISEATAQAEGARGLTSSELSGKLNIAGRIGSALAPSVGAKTVKAGQALQGGLPKLGGTPATRIAGTQLAGRALMGGLPTTETPTTTTGMEPYATTTGMGGYGTTGLTGMSALGGTDTSQSIYTKEAVAQDIQNDLATTGGANMDKYITLYNFLNPETTTTAKSAYGKPSASQYALASSGTSALQSLADQLSQDQSLLTKTAVPGQNLPLIGGLISNIAGTGEYQATAQNVLDALARARTGAAMTASEEAFYTRMLPRAGDSEATVQSKIAALQEAFAPFLNSQSAY